MELQVSSIFSQHLSNVEFEVQIWDLFQEVLLLEKVYLILFLSTTFNSILLTLSSTFETFYSFVKISRSIVNFLSCF